MWITRAYHEDKSVEKKSETPTSKKPMIFQKLLSFYLD